MKPFADISKRQKHDANKSKRILFVNSVGGFGDTLLVPLVIKYYKYFFPNDECILYDSMGLYKYYKNVPYVDKHIRAAQPFGALKSDYAVKIIGECVRDDPTNAVEISEKEFDFFVNTHHLHGHTAKTDSEILYIDYAFALEQVIAQKGFLGLKMTLKDQHDEIIQKILNRLKEEGRILIGIQNRAHDPYHNHAVRGFDYIKSIQKLSELFIESKRATILQIGDAPIPDDWRYVTGEYRNLNFLLDFYYKLEIFKRLDIVVGSVSGFTFTANLLRDSRLVPLVVAFPLLEALNRPPFPIYMESKNSAYIQGGGGVSYPFLNLTFRDALLPEFYKKNELSSNSLFDFMLIMAKKYGLNL
jgi:hypothetical protein